MHTIVRILAFFAVVRATTAAAAPCAAGTFAETDGSCSPCPRGHWCAAGVSQPCAAGTQNDLVGSNSAASCGPCPAGSLCAEGGAAPPLAPCPPGHYCPAASSSALACPAGTHRAAGTDAFSAADCKPCPGGYYCAAAAAIYRGCPAGSFCPPGDGDAPRACPAGSFCPPNTRAAQPCPAGSHCGAAAAAPTRCPRGSFCPPRAAAPTLCPLGTAAFEGASDARRTAEEACAPCAPGSTGDHTRRTSCVPCKRGAFCAGRGAVAVECPPGHYCPAASAAPVACPAGTASAATGATGAGACAPCPAGRFAWRDGRAECAACPAASSSVDDATRCECAGRGRVFRAASATCGCARGWTSAATPAAGRSGIAAACERDAPLPRCPLTRPLRDHRGRCRALDGECGARCGELGGVFVATLGLCDCYADAGAAQTQTPPRPTTRPTTPTQCVAGGALHVALAGGETLSLSAAELGAALPHCPSGRCCALHSVVVAEARLAASSAAAPRVARAVAKRRRRLSSSTSSGITYKRAAICVEKWSGVLFDFGDPNDVAGAKDYPVYVSDSLLNTNAAFDGAAFDASVLAARSAPANLLGASQGGIIPVAFETEGVYVFALASHPTELMVVAVQPEGAVCPANEAPIMPLSAQAMLQIGVALDRDLIAAPNWPFFFFLAALFLGLAGGGVVVTIVGNLQGWKIAPVVGDPKYRATQRRFPLGKYNESVAEKTAGEEDEGGLRRRIADDRAADAVAMATAMLEDDEGEEEEGDDGGWARCLRDDDITLSELYERLAAHDRTTHKWHADSSEQSQDLLSRIRTDLAELQNKVNPALGAASVGFVARAWRKEIASRNAYWENFNAAVQEVGVALKYLFGVVGGASPAKMKDAVKLMLDDQSWTRQRGESAEKAGSELPFVVAKTRDTARVLFDLCELTIAIERDRRSKCRAQLVLPAGAKNSPLAPLLAGVSEAEEAHWKEIWRMKAALEALSALLERNSDRLETACGIVRAYAEKKASKVRTTGAGGAEQRRFAKTKAVKQSASTVQPSLARIGASIKKVARQWKTLVKRAHVVLVAEKNAVGELEDALWPLLAELEEFGEAEEEEEVGGFDDGLLEGIGGVGGDDERSAAVQAAETEGEELQRMTDRVALDRTVQMGDSVQQAEAQVDRLEAEFHLDGVDAEWILKEAAADQAKLQTMLDSQSATRAAQLQSRLKAKRAKRMQASNEKRAEKDRLAAVTVQHEAQLQRLRDKAGEELRALVAAQDAIDAQERETSQASAFVGHGKDMLIAEIAQRKKAHAKEIEQAKDKMRAARKARSSAVEMDREREMQKLRLLTRYAEKGERETQLLKASQGEERAAVKSMVKHNVVGAADMLARQEEAHQAAADALEERLAAEREVGVEAVAAELDELAASGRAVTAITVAELELQRVDREHQAQLDDLARRLAREKLGKAQKLEARLAKRRAAATAKLEAKQAIKAGQRKQGQAADMEARRAALDGDGESTKWLDDVQKQLNGGSGASAEQSLIKQLEVEQVKQSSALAEDHSRALRDAAASEAEERAEALAEFDAVAAEERTAQLALLEREKQLRLRDAANETEALALTTQFERDHNRKIARFDADAARRRAKKEVQLDLRCEKLLRRIAAEHELQQANEKKSQAQVRPRARSAPRAARALPSLRSQRDRGAHPVLARLLRSPHPLFCLRSTLRGFA